MVMMDKDANIKIQQADDKAAMHSLRDYLRKGCAVAMVGCGFSRNAIRRDPKVPPPVEWDAFARVFASKLLGCEAADNEEVEKYIKGKTPLMLSHEYESVFGRSSMIDVVKDLIHDENLIPSVLHEKFLKLGWTDVYTTNYDTLLERTIENIPEVPYRVIVNTKQIVGTQQRRLVKLHGTWDGPIGDWIVTDEDYRQYPQRFAPFVNMVRQACMESCLCLVGFSGTDPNFLAWIGWVRDNMGEAGYPIYLLTNRSMYQGEREWFVKRRIIPVDIFGFTGAKADDYVTAFTKIFNFLCEPGVSDVNPSSAGWRFFLERGDVPCSKKDLLKSWIQAIRKYREVYPDWVVAPSTIRERVQELSAAGVFENAFAAACDCLDGSDRIIAFGNLNWYLSLGMQVMRDGVYRANKSILDSICRNSARQAETLGSDVLNECADLFQEMLRCSREFGDNEQFDEIFRLIDDFLGCDKNRLHYEKFLLSKRDLDIASMERIICEWAKLKKDEEWQIKFASALVTLGRVDEARRILTSTLVDIRKKLPFGDNPIDKRYLNLEGIGLYILLLLSSGSSEAENDTFNKEMINARLQRLSSHGCNPKDEIDRFMLMFNGRFEARKTLNSERKFDYTTQTWTFGFAMPGECVQSGVLTHYFEDTGIPFDVGNGKTFSNEWWKAFLQRYLYQYSKAARGLDWICAVSNLKYDNHGFDEGTLCRMPNDSIQVLLQNCINRIRYIYNAFDGLYRFDLHGVYTNILKYSLDIASRLVSRVNDQELIGEVLDCGLILYRNYSDKFRSVKDVAPDFFRRVESAMTVESVIRRLPDILSSIPSDESALIFEYERLSPLTALTYVQHDKEAAKADEKLQKKISYLLNGLDDPALNDSLLKDNITKLCHCEYLGLLNEFQGRNLAQKVKNFIEGQKKAVNDLSLAYISRLMSRLDCRDCVVNKIARESLNGLQVNLSFSNQHTIVYAGLEHVFGARNATSQSHCIMDGETKSILKGFVTERIKTMIEALNKRDAAAFERNAVLDELHSMDVLCGDVLSEYLVTGKNNIYGQLKEIYSVEFDDRDLPLMYMVSHMQGEALGIDDFIWNFNTFDSSRRMNHLLSSFGYLAYQLNQDSSIVLVIGRYLVELFSNTTKDYFIDVCHSLAVWIACFDILDQLFLGREASFCRVLEDTQYYNQSRFSDDSIMDKRAAYSYLCGTIWSKLDGLRDVGIPKIRACIDEWRKSIEAGNELARIRNSWDNGISLGKGT